MKRCVLSAVLCVAFALALPMAVRRYWPPREAAAPPGPSSAATAVPEGAYDASLSLKVLTGGETVSMTMAEYLPGVLAGEMPLSFDPEALKAQAVAARTYALYCAGHTDSRHPGADVCGDPACCQVWLSEEALRSAWGKTYEQQAAEYAEAVRATDGAFLEWQGEPILACFHASSPGRTENCAALWGTSLPYLVSVDTPEGEATVPDYVTSAELTDEAFRAAIEAACPEADLTAPPETWREETVRDASGRVASLRVGGAVLTGPEVRRIFSLRSACFTVERRENGFLFTVTGSGHGVGMSQYGADVLAREGFAWEEILAHYYPGTTLVRAGSQPAADSGG